MRRLLLLPLVRAASWDPGDLQDRTVELIQRVVKELAPLSQLSGELPPLQGESMMQEMVSHAWNIPAVEETVGIQYLLLDLTAKARAGLPSPKAIQDLARREALQQARAMLSAIEAAVPICRTNDVCIVDKLSMMIWRLAEGGAEDLLNAGERWPFFRAMKPLLPPHARWETPWQCPTTLWPGLEARPMWPLDALPEGSAARRLFLALRSGAEEIRQDLTEGILSQDGMTLVKDPAWPGLSHGKWMAFSLFRAPGFFGRRAVSRELDPLRCRLTPRTCRILQAIRAPPGMVENLPALQSAQEVVDFLRADPGTTVSFHAASTNSRLTVQVCLSGCGSGEEGSEGGSFVQAGPVRQYYRFGEPVVFDDSFLHRVVVDKANAGPRWVLSLQVLHPTIDTARGFSEHFAYQKPVPGTPGDLAEQEEGVPPALEEGVESAYPVEPLTFLTKLQDTILLYTAIWGPDGDGPEVFLSEVPGAHERPHGGGRGSQLPPLAHRTRLVVRSVGDGSLVAEWRVDARPGGRRSFELPAE